MSSDESAGEIREAINDSTVDIETAIKELGRTITETTKSPERYIRINITKNSKGYTYETTVSLRWEYIGTVDPAYLLDQLNREADQLARLDIARREALDDWKQEHSGASAELNDIKQGQS